MDDVQKSHSRKQAASMNSENRTATAVHTPGPWRVSGEVNARYLNGVGDVTLVRRTETGDDRYVAIATLDAMGDGSIRTTQAEREANARLIAAAPDMLAALRLIEQERDWLRDMLEQQSCSDLCDKTYEFQGCPSGTCAREAGLATFRIVTHATRAAIAKATGAA